MVSCLGAGRPVLPTKTQIRTPLMTQLDDLQQFLQELFQVLDSAQVGQIDDLLQYIRRQASLEEIRSRTSEILGP